MTPKELQQASILKSSTKSKRNTYSKYNGILEKIVKSAKENSNNRATTEYRVTFEGIY